MGLIKDVSEILVFDTETTGLDTETCRIVTASAVVVDKFGIIKDQVNVMIDPTTFLDLIDPEAFKVNRLSVEELQESGLDPRFGIERLADFIEKNLSVDVPLVAYNARYDLTLLDRELRRYDLPAWNYDDMFPVFDPFVVDKMIDKFRRGKRRLIDLLSIYDVASEEEIEGLHTAENDALYTGKLAFKMFERKKFVSKYGDMTFTDLHDILIGEAYNQAVSLEEWLRKTDESVVVDKQWPFTEKTKKPSKSKTGKKSKKK